MPPLYCAAAMGKPRGGSQCCAYGCKKRKKTKAEQQENDRSDSDGNADEDTNAKRTFPRTFHK